MTLAVRVEPGEFLRFFPLPGWDYNTPYTVVCWARTVSALGATEFTFKVTNYATNQEDQLLLGPGSGGLDRTLRVSNAAGSTANIGTAYTTGVFTYESMVRESATSLKSYIGASSVADITNVRDVTGRAISATIQAFDLAADRRLAFIGVWTAALSQAERAAQMVSSVPVRTADLYLFCPCQGDLLDISGNGRDLVLNGGTASYEAGPDLAWLRDESSGLYVPRPPQSAVSVWT